MTRAGPTRPKVALALVPPLLAESLRALLVDRAEVAIILDPTEERFDVAIVGGGAPEIIADAVIVLDQDPAAHGGGAVESSSHDAPTRLDDLEDVLAFVQQLRHA